MDDYYDRLSQFLEIMNSNTKTKDNPIDCRLCGEETAYVDSRDDSLYCYSCGYYTIG
jgi:ribosomal protein L37E